MLTKTRAFSSEKILGFHIWWSKLEHSLQRRYSDFTYDDQNWSILFREDTRILHMMIKTGAFSSEKILGFHIWWSKLEDSLQRRYLDFTYDDQNWSILFREDTRILHMMIKTGAFSSEKILGFYIWWSKMEHSLQRRYLHFTYDDQNWSILFREDTWISHMMIKAEAFSSEKILGFYIWWSKMEHSLQRRYLHFTYDDQKWSILFREDTWISRMMIKAEAFSSEKILGFYIWWSKMEHSLQRRYLDFTYDDQSWSILFREDTWILHMMIKNGAFSSEKILGFHVWWSKLEHSLQRRYLDFTYDDQSWSILFREDTRILHMMIKNGAFSSEKILAFHIWWSKMEHSLQRRYLDFTYDDQSWSILFREDTRILHMMIKAGAFSSEKILGFYIWWSKLEPSLQRRYSDFTYDDQNWSILFREDTRILHMMIKNSSKIRKFICLYGTFFSKQKTIYLLYLIISHLRQIIIILSCKFILITPLDNGHSSYCLWQYILLWYESIILYNILYW